MAAAAGHDWQIAAAGAADFAAVMRVMAAAFDPAFGEAWSAGQLTGLAAMPGTRLAVVRAAGEVAGFYAARLAGPESELLLLAVDPAAQAQGLGRALVADWQDWARAAGAGEHLLEVRADNAAVAFYRAAGFQQIGQRKNYYHGNDGSQRDALTMKMTVSATR